MTHFKKFLLTLLIGGIALLSEFVFHQPLHLRLSHLLEDSRLLDVLEMIKTLRSGRYGVDVLAITAILASAKNTGLV